jgi:uncharacterized protein (TIGR00730 family)
MNHNKIITIFGSSKPKPGEESYERAYLVGKTLAEAGFGICNGGYGGTMEAGSKGAKDVGGVTIGITCNIFGRSGPNAFLDEIIETNDLHTRLTKLIDIACGYVVLPGGSGTLVELSLVWELVAKKLITQKPIILMGDFWKPVIEIAAIERPKSLAFIQYAHTPADVVRILTEVM